MSKRQAKPKKNPDLVTDEEFVTCMICSRKFKWIQNSHLSSHLLTLEKYKKLYPGAPTKTRGIQKKIDETRYRIDEEDLPICAREGCNNRVATRGNKYCSYSCNGKVRARDEGFIQYITPKNPESDIEKYGLPRYTTQRYNKKVAFERDEHKCQRCGKLLEEGNFNYDMHHLIPRKLVEDKNFIDQVDNLVTLCKDDHKTVEHEILKHIFDLYIHKQFLELPDLMHYLRSKI